MARMRRGAPSPMARVLVDVTTCAKLASDGSGEQAAMAGSVTRDEFMQLAVRVDLVEREVEGEKLVTRHILDQTRHNGDDWPPSRPGWIAWSTNSMAWSTRSTAWTERSKASTSMSIV